MECPQRFHKCEKVIFVFFICIILIQGSVSAKYVFEYEFEIADLDIDRSKPQIEVMQISNTNKNYENFANKTHFITIRVKVIERNKANDELQNNEVEILVNNLRVTDCNINVKKISENSQESVYDIELTNLKGNGNLTLSIVEGAIKDTSGLTNDKKVIATNILIDNIPPKGIIKKEKIEDGKVKANISTNEKVREVEGWNLSDDAKLLTNEFMNNLYYKLKLVDYAQNPSEIEIDISEATNIIVSYASHNSEYGWSYGYSNYDIAGKEAVKMNPIYKTEALAFMIKGNVDKDFLKVRAYDFNYWGTIGVCSLTSKKYYNGYNPNLLSWESMNSETLIELNGEKYFELGGAGVNQAGRRDFYGNKPIPVENARKYMYGISGINMKLKDESYFSVVYQVLVDKVGWVEPKSDGEECLYNHANPISAFRMALVPQKEKQYIIDMWNKDVGTFNLE